jgi:hypothetical protein
MYADTINTSVLPSSTKQATATRDFSTGSFIRKCLTLFLISNATPLPQSFL